MNRRLRFFPGRLLLAVLMIFISVNCASDWKVVAQPRPPSPPPGRSSEPPHIPPGQIPPVFHPTVLKVLQLEMSPDPVGEGQRVSFQVTISNPSQHSGRATIYLEDRDETVSMTHDVLLRPGNNRISLPQTNYRFSRTDHCFTVEVDIDQTRRPIDMAKEFCLQRTSRGWSLTGDRVGPLRVEDLRMSPDPVRPGEPIRFTLRLRNEGNPIRADIRIQDRDEVVVRLNNANITRGYVDFQFPNTRYVFQRTDHCFTVILDVERTPHKVDSVREFCAKPAGWTLKP